MLAQPLQRFKLSILLWCTILYAGGGGGEIWHLERRVDFLYFCEQDPINVRVVLESGIMEVDPAEWKDKDSTVHEYYIKSSTSILILLFKLNT